MAELSVIEKFWYSKSPLKWFFYPFSLFIELIVGFKYFLYKKRLLKARFFTVPVIVVGNITVGGTGKTPFISYIVKKFHQKGIRVGIVSRGYKSNAPVYPHIVGDTDTADIVGDEAFMQHQNLKVPMAIGADRALAVDALIQKYQLDLIISDDGLQHYRMGRDFEILMVDSRRRFGNQLMIPFGPLREPISRVKTVDYVVQNGDSEGSLTDNEMITGTMKIRSCGLIHIDSNEVVSLTNLRENTICAVAGIGNPERFFDTLSSHCDKFKKVVFPDHHAFKADDFKGIRSDMVVMTEKDAVKCHHFAQDNWYFLKVEASLENHEFNNLYNLIDETVLRKA